MSLGTVIPEFIIKLKKGDKKHMLNIERLRDVWFETSYMLDRMQSGEGHAHCRFKNYKRQDLGFQFKQSFTGKASSYGIELSRRTKTWY